MINLSITNPEDTAQIFEVVGVGVVVFDVDETSSLRLVSTNEVYRTMYGMDHDADVGCSIDGFHPDYIQKHYQQQFQACCDIKGPVDDELLLELSGQSYWYRIRMVPVFGEDGCMITRILTTSVDITQQKIFEEELGIVSSRLEAIVDSTHDAIVSIDENHAIKTFNQAAEKLFGYDREHLVGQSMEMLIPQGARPQHAGHINSFSKSAVKSREMETRAEVVGLRSDGSNFPAEVSIAKIDVHGKNEFTAIVRDISIQMRLLDELTLRATSDPLTNISNRRHLVEVAEMEIERCDRYDHPMSLLLLDLDDFKSINDTYGHTVGDDVLRELGKLLKQRSRQLDVPARWGGEEFCLLIPEVKLEDAHSLCVRLLEDIRGIHNNIPALGQRVVTASIGLAAYYKGDCDVNKLVHLADEAMYEAKHSGKNKVCMAKAVD